jgi:hypothetical protein
VEPVNIDAMLARFAEHWSQTPKPLLLFEPSDVANTGDAGGELTAEVEQLA